MVGEYRLYYLHSGMMFAGTVDLFCFPEIENTQNWFIRKKERKKEELNTPTFQFQRFASYNAKANTPTSLRSIILSKWACSHPVMHHALSLPTDVRKRSHTLDERKYQKWLFMPSPKWIPPRELLKIWVTCRKWTWIPDFLIVYQFIDSFYATREQGKEKVLRTEGMLLKPRREGQRALL